MRADQLQVEKCGHGEKWADGYLIHDFVVIGVIGHVEPQVLQRTANILGNLSNQGLLDGDILGFGKLLFASSKGYIDDVGGF